jgi:hypothetical protein
MDIQEIGFGDFCTIEQKRYVGPNEFYGYKVVGRKKSNVWTDVPVDANNEKETLHDHLDDVVTVVCNNLDDRTVHQFRVSDLASVRKAQAVPEGFVLVGKSELETLKSNNDHFTKSCIDWTDRAYKQRAKVEHIKNEVERFKQSGTHLDLSRFLDNLIEFSTFKHDAEFEGFILVPKEPTLEMCHRGRNTRSFKVQDIYKAMIEAQEQSHD